MTLSEAFVVARKILCGDFVSEEEKQSAHSVLADWHGVAEALSKMQTEPYNTKNKMNGYRWKGK